MVPDPYARYLEQADQLLAQGEVVRAGQIWQAILKQVPDHGPAREGLLRVREWLEAQHAREEAQRLAAMAPPPARETEPTPQEVPPIREETLAEVPAPPPEPSPALPAPPPAAPEPAAAPVPSASSEDIDRMMREGCTLYDMGQVEDALLKWEALLRLEPAHQLTREYVASARRDLGLPPLGEGAPPPPPAPSAALAATLAPPQVSQEAIEEAEKLLREGCLLWDMGLGDEATGKWRKALELAPHRQDIRHFLENAELENVTATTALQPAQLHAIPHHAPAAQAPAPDPATEAAVQTKLKQAEHLLGLQRWEEAEYTLIQAERMAPGHAQVQESLRRARAHEAPAPEPSAGSTTPLSSSPGLARRQAPAISVEVDQEAFQRTSPGFSAPAPVAKESTETKEPSGPQGVQPPASLTRSTAPARSGLNLPAPKLLDQIQGLEWVKDPKVWAITGGVIILAVVGGSMIHSFRKDAQLKADVQAARARALQVAASEAKIEDLSLSRADILAEARQALSEDPVRAYLRVQYLLRLNPGDADAAQLQPKALASLTQGGVAGASEAEFQRLVTDGNLDAAHKVMDALLRVKPDDSDLHIRAARLERALAEDHAAQGHFDDARLDLLRARALQPEDPAWQARLKLLDQLRAMPKAQRLAWTPLLG